VDIRGPAGADGSSGAAANGAKLTYNTATSGDPGSGKFRLNSATISLANSLAISETDGDGNSIAAFLALLDDGMNQSRTLVRLIKDDGTKEILGYLQGTLSDQGTYDTFTWKYAALRGSPANNDVFYLTAIPLGDEGSQWIDYAPSGTNNITNNTGEQNPFVGSNHAGLLDVPASTDYLFEIHLELQYVGTITSHTVSFRIGGTSIGGGHYTSQAWNGSVNVASSGSMAITDCDQVATATVLDVANTSTRRSFRIVGGFRTGVSPGNVKPLITFSAGPTNSNVNIIQGSFIRITKVGAL
jgi:hypothetical protein